MRDVVTGTSMEHTGAHLGSKKIRDHNIFVIYCFYLYKKQWEIKKKKKNSPVEPEEETEK
jgi:hypothetical protein